MPLTWSVGRASSLYYRRLDVPKLLRMIAFCRLDIRAPSNIIGPHQTFSQSRGSKPARSLQLSSASFSRCCCPSLSASRRTECIFTTEAMVVYSTWPASCQNQSATGSQMQMLFEVDSALTAHSEEALRGLTNCFDHACREQGLTVSPNIVNRGDWL